MIDIVLDTCTLVHADNPESQYQDSSIELIQRMYANNTMVTVDEGFELDETHNQSYIGLEYLKHLAPSSLGFNLIKDMALLGRLSFVSNVPPYHTKKYIERIIRNKKDRIFLRVAFNSEEKTLVSHDFTDYQVPKRVTIERDIDTVICIADEINGQL